jgi:hypothetical protein
MLRGISFAVKGHLENMSGWNPSRPPRPPWDTQEQPSLPAEGTWYGAAQGPRVVIRPQGSPGGGKGPGFSEPPRRTNRKAVIAGTGIGLVVVVGLAYGAVKVAHVTWGESAAKSTLPTTIQNVTAPAATPTTTAAASPSSTPTATTGTTKPAVTYALSAPATAGGYSRTPSVSPTVQAIGSGGATELMTTVEASGGKATSNVSAEYQIIADQVLGYAGYNGTFSPQDVIKDFQAGAAGVQSEPAGPHGGQLACGQVTVTSPATTTGEACVWATTSTVGMVEFYGDSGGALETVTPAKAGADALKFRDDVEAARR